MQDVSKGEGRTVLFVSHNMTAVKSLCNKGVLLSNGTVTEIGEINSVISSYLGMNKFDGIKFINDITYTAPYINISKIEINNKTSNPIRLSLQNNILKIHIEGVLSVEQMMAFEFRLYDNNETPLAFYSPFHYSGVTPLLKKGKFIIDEKISFPQNINKGTYSGSLFLTNPGIAYHFSIENAIHIEMEGFPTLTGNVFEYDKGSGFLFLK